MTATTPSTTNQSTHPNDSNQPNKTAKGSLFVITAASGTGKTSLVKELIAETDGLEVSVSHTTRPPRPGEENGVHYHFTDADTFQADIATGKFLEHAQVFDNFYGTSKQAVSDKLEAGLDVVLEIDWQGALQVKELFADAVLVFILPPSRAALRERLSNRGQDSEAVIEKRLAGAVTEMQNYLHFDYVVINDDFATALNELKAIVTAHRLACTRQACVYDRMIHALLSE